MMYKVSIFVMHNNSGIWEDMEENFHGDFDNMSIFICKKSAQYVTALLTNMLICFEFRIYERMPLPTGVYGFYLTRTISLG